MGTLHTGEEYRELNNHTRECWKYISDLLRHYVLLQIALFSALFLSDTDTVTLSAVWPLAVIGLVGSIGALFQNHRLFKNATKFVRRAAYLESISDLPEDTKSEKPDDERKPPNIYMEGALYKNVTDGLDLKYLLHGLYSLLALFWAYYFFSVVS